MSTRTSNIERDEQGKRMLEKRKSFDAEFQVDDLHREMGERLTAGVLGVLDLLSGAHRSQSDHYQPISTSAIESSIRRVMDDELATIRNDVAELRRHLDEIKAGIQRIDRFTMQRMLGLNNDEPPQSRNSLIAECEPEPQSGRAAKALVTQRVFATARKLAESGQDITQMAATSLAREAGVKPAQFTYAFKNREGFLVQFRLWLDTQKSA